MEYLGQFQDTILYYDKETQVIIQYDKCKAEVKLIEPVESGCPTLIKFELDNEHCIRIWTDMEDLDVEWMKNNVLHRDGDLPAMIKFGIQYYFRDGILHRDGDLPAIARPNGELYYFKNGVQYSPEGTSGAPLNQ